MYTFLSYIYYENREIVKDNYAVKNNLGTLAIKFDNASFKYST